MSKTENRILKAISDKMKEHKHSQNFLASEIGISQNQISRFFNSPRGGFVDVACKILEYYNIQLITIH